MHILIVSEPGLPLVFYVDNATNFKQSCRFRSHDADNYSFFVENIESCYFYQNWLRNEIGRLTPVTDPRDIIDMIVLKIWKWKNHFQRNEQRWSDWEEYFENDKSIFLLFCFIERLLLSQSLTISVQGCESISIAHYYTWKCEKLKYLLWNMKLVD